MRYILPSLLCAGLGLAGYIWHARSSPAANSAGAAQAAAGTSQSVIAVDPNAEPLFHRAIAAVEAYDTISAKIRHKAELFEQPMTGAGTYVQGPLRYQLSRLELKLQVGQETSTLLQVCDGKSLWIQQEFKQDQRLRQIDLDRIRQAIEAAPQSPLAGQPFETLGWGGLSQLLRGIDQNFGFTTVHDTLLGKLPVRALQAQWRPARLAAVLPEQQAAIEQGAALDLSKLPDHLPDQVLVLLGQDDLFPYRIEFRRSGLKQARLQAPLPAGSSRALLTMEFYEVQVNGPIDTMQFVFQSGEQKVTDATNTWLERRGLPIVNK